MVTIKIETDNAAFFDDPGTELARILRLLANKSEMFGTEDMDGVPIFDVNGNRVGEVRVRGR